MKQILLKSTGLLVMWGMLILTGIQSNNILWLLFAIITFAVVFAFCKISKTYSTISQWFKYHKSWLKYLLIGGFLGTTYSIIRFLILVNIGAIKVLQVFPDSFNMIIIPVVFLIIPNIYTALAEEVIFRGYVINSLLNNLNRSMAIGISAVIFLFAHIMNVNGIFSISRIIELLALGSTLAVIYLRTNSLWTSIGLHFGINFFTFLLVGQNTRQYVLLSEKTANYDYLMKITDSILPILLFVFVTVITKVIFKSTLKESEIKDA
jgi:uncharacterized protein